MCLFRHLTIILKVKKICVTFGALFLNFELLKVLNTLLSPPLQLHACYICLPHWLHPCYLHHWLHPCYLHHWLHPCLHHWLHPCWLVLDDLWFGPVFTFFTLHQQMFLLPGSCFFNRFFVVKIVLVEFFCTLFKQKKRFCIPNFLLFQQNFLLSIIKENEKAI